MTGHQAAISVVAILVAGVFTGPLPTSAQTFESYRCAAGTSFIVGFYQYDSRAFLQVDGRAIPLKKRLEVSGARYPGRGDALGSLRSALYGQRRDACDRQGAHHHQARQTSGDGVRTDLRTR